MRRPRLITAVELWRMRQAPDRRGGWDELDAARWWVVVSVAVALGCLGWIIGWGE